MMNPCCDLVGAGLLPQTGKELLVLRWDPRESGKPAHAAMRKHWTYRTVQIWAWLSIFPWNILSLAVICSIFWKLPFLLEKAIFPMHQYFACKHNLPFFSVYPTSYVSTLKRPIPSFESSYRWEIQGIFDVSRKLLWAPLNSEPWSTAKVTSQLWLSWPSPGKKNFGIIYSLGNSPGNLLLFVYSPRF